MFSYNLIWRKLESIAGLEQLFDTERWYEPVLRLASIVSISAAYIFISSNFYFFLVAFACFHLFIVLWNYRVSQALRDARGLLWNDLIGFVLSLLFCICAGWLHNATAEFEIAARSYVGDPVAYQTFKYSFLGQQASFIHVLGSLAGAMLINLVWAVTKSLR